MTAQNPSPSAIEKKIQSYLEALSPGAREMLVRGIESAKVHGDVDAHLDMILTVARSTERPTRSAEDVEAAFKKAFFAPLHQFLVKEKLSVRQDGRVSVSSIEPIWIWVKRDVARDLIASALQALAASSDPLEKAAIVYAAKIRAKALPMARRYIDLLSDSQDEMQRLAGQLGDRQTLADARDVLDIFQFSDILDSVLKKTPAKLEDEPEGPLRQQVGAINAFADKYPRKVHLLAIRYLSHAATPAVLVRLAHILSKSATATAIEKTMYKPFVDVAWSEIDRHVEVVRGRKTFTDRNGTMEEALLDLHRTVRRIQIAIDVEGMTDWGRRLADCRRETSDLLRDLIEGIPGEVVRALRTKSTGDRISGPDPESVETARESLKVLRAARQAIDSLALNNIVNKTRTQVEQVIETNSKTQIDRLRNAPSDERAALTEVVEAIIDFARIVFDEDYAALIRRSLHVATTKASLKSA